MYYILFYATYYTKLYILKNLIRPQSKTYVFANSQISAMECLDIFYRYIGKYTIFLI